MEQPFLLAAILVNFGFGIFFFRHCSRKISFGSFPLQPTGILATRSGLEVVTRGLVSSLAEVEVTGAEALNKSNIPPP